MSEGITNRNILVRSHLDRNIFDSIFSSRMAISVSHLSCDATWLRILLYAS